ncbi:peptidoglycan editing factor PgeF [Alphaproteobacteria bacterium]|nr:peptidoglycan editing factor PgeF [Alphaproteobacteria bacterium]
MNYIRSKNLNSYKHGFFSRKGGVSKSLYKSLNCGYSSNDALENIKKNRRIILNKFNLNFENLIVPEQFHSNKIKIFKEENKIYKCDGIINAVPGIALGVLTADCCPILIGHKKKLITGVIHAGWKGVINGILENFITKASVLNYNKKDLIFALGPCIGRKSYEVSKTFKLAFTEKYEEAKYFFTPKSNKNFFNFDLRGCIIMILKKHNISDIWSSKSDTYKYPNSYFSYRYSVHKGYKDYGRMLSLILK